MQSMNHQDDKAAAVQAILQAFLDALDRGEDALERWFTPDATMYFPFRNSQALLHGREAIVARFVRMNAQLRQTQAAPPYIGFGMRDFRVEWLAPGWALVTALFTFADQWGRRTLLLRAEDADAWRIHHLHASNLPAPQA
jgi:ketosteroid isomerase-like protein